MVAGATTKIVSGGDAVIRGIIRATERDAAAAARAAAAVALKFFCRRPLPPGEPAERRRESVSVCSRKPFLMGSLTL